MTSKVKFGYIGSGTGHIKAYNRPLLNNEPAIKTVNEYINKIRTEDHKFGLLFNAHVEPAYGGFLKDHYSECLDEIHADSGGLQIMSKGDKITSEMKKNIYGVQAKYSDIAMSFDEIPVITFGKNQGPGSLAKRMFDTENFETRAKESAANLTEQIREFQNIGTKARPMLILHGNTMERYLAWHDICMNEIPEELHKFIGGVAVASPAQGYGFTKDAVKALVTAKLSQVHKHFHILGVGSINRMVPYLVFRNNGMIKDDTFISYDSTSHTMGLSVGAFFNKNFELTSITRQFSSKYNEIYQDISELYDLGYSVEEFHKIVNSNSSYYYLDQDKTKDIDIEKLVNYYKGLYGFFCKSVKNFMNVIDSSTDETVLLGDGHNHGVCEEFSIPIRMLMSIRDFEDMREFEDWYNAYNDPRGDIKTRNDPTLDDHIGEDIGNIDIKKADEYKRENNLLRARQRSRIRQENFSIEDL